MSVKIAKAAVRPARQQTQYSCMSACLAMCLQANGRECTEDEVNQVMGARPMRGAAWEDAIACAQHFGQKAVLMCPCSVPQLKRWTDMGVPVVIAWNPEDRPWAHASVVFDVTEDDRIQIADPNIPDPDEVIRDMSKSDFYKKWAEKHQNGYLIRRPAMAILPEITPDGRQMWASVGRETSAVRVASRYLYRS